MWSRNATTECQGFGRHASLNTVRSMAQYAPLYTTSMTLSFLPCRVSEFFDRADKAMQAYTGALGELRENMQESTFASWTLEQLQVRRPLAVLVSRALH